MSPLRLPFRHSGFGDKITGSERDRRPFSPGCKQGAESIDWHFPCARFTGAGSPHPWLPPWHDIPTGPEPPLRVTAVIEIPTNERNKYELDKKLGVFRLDRVLHSAVHYPGDYGFLPQTLAQDGDPLDILVLTTIPVFTGCLVDARPIGLFHLIDKGVADEKILAVPLHDPYSEGINDLPDLQQHHLREVEHFFQVYKDLEGTGTETRGFEDAAAARAEIRRAMAAYQTHIHDRSRSRRPRISQRP